MKPSINSVFPWLNKEELKECFVERIRISKHFKKMQIIITEELLPSVKLECEKLFCRYYKMNNVIIKTADVDDINEFEEVDYDIQYNNETPSGPKYIPRDLGKAHSGNVIYGGSVRSNLVPISSINDGSKDVCFEGYVFEFEEKDI